MENVLWMIYAVLVCLLIGKDMSGKEELREIKKQLKRIADQLEGMQKHGD